MTGILYILTLADFFFVTLFPRSGIAPYLALLDGAHTIYILEQHQQFHTPAPPFWLPAIKLFHRDNPAVLVALAKFHLENAELKLAKEEAEQAIQNDPKNLAGYETLAMVLEKQGERENILVDARLLSAGFLSKEDQKNVTELVALYAPHFNTNALPKLVWNHVGTDHVPEFIASALYLAGLEAVRENPSLTYSLWKEAYAIEPSLSYYAVEQSSLLVTYFHDKEKALAVLRECQRNPVARNHCAEIEADLRRDIVLPVGFFEKDFRKGMPILSP